MPFSCSLSLSILTTPTTPQTRRFACRLSGIEKYWRHCSCGCATLRDKEVRSPIVSNQPAMMAVVWNHHAL
ncbi:hypothetical protein M3J09_011168 [Ascochyta lentis]